MLDKKTILLIEDDAITTIYEAKLLKKNNFEVITASSGEQAIEIMKNDNQIDLILMDINLGKDMDGTEAAEIILKDNDVPVVFLSSHIEAEIVEKTEKITSYGYVVKNSGDTILIASIKMAFRLHEARLELKKHEEILRSILDECRQVENALKNSEENFRMLVENAPEAIFVQTKGTFAYLNNAAVKLFGADSAEQLLDQPVLERFHPDFHKIIKERIKLLNEEKKTVPRMEQKHVKIDGTLIDVEVSAVPINFKSNNGALVFVRDISEQKKMEKSLKEKDEIFNLFMEYSPIYVFFKDENIKAIQLSKNYEKMLDKPINEILGKTMDDLFPSDLAKKMIEDDKKILKEGKPFELIEKLNNRIFKTLKFPIIREGKPNLLAGFTIDITDQQNFEKNIKNNAEHFNIITNTSMDGFVITDMNGHILDVNKAYCKMIGYNKKELLKMSVTDIETKESQTETIKHLHKIINNGSDRFESKHQCKDGHIINVEVSSTFFNQSNQILVFLRDITEHKKTEIELQKSETFLNNIIEQSPYGIWIADEKGLLIKINKACCDLLKIREKEVLKKYNILNDNIVKEQGLLPLVKKVFDLGESVRFEINYDTSQLEHLKLLKKSIVILDTIIFPIKDENGKVINAVIQHMDITERKHAEETLRESEARFKMMFEQSPLGLALSDKSYHFVQANDTFCKMLGYKKEELINLTFKDITHPDYLTHDTKEIAKLTNGEIKTYQTEKKYIRKDNQIVWGTLNVTTLRNTAGEVHHYFIMVEDITKRKQAEEALEKSVIEKEALLRELQHRVKNSFNIITSIVGLEADRKDSHDINTILMSIKNRINSIANLYDMLYKSGEIQVIRLDLYIKELINSLKSAYITDNKHIELNIELNEINIEVKLAVSIGLILNELLTNSLKYAFKERQNGIIQIKLKKSKSEISLEIADNGIGLPALFDIDKVESLGLLLVRMLTQQINGKIKIGDNEGTKFNIKFPIK